MKDVLICLPTRNEAANIQYMIDKLKILNYPIIVADANSRDGTVEIAKKNNIEVYQREGHGKAYGVRKALQVAKEKKAKILVFIDCDRTYPTQAIPKMVELMQHNDTVICYRSQKHIKPLHRIGNNIHTIAINLLFGSNLKDINSGLRAIRVDKYNKLRSVGFDIEAELTIIAIRNHLRIKQFLIRYEERTGDSKIRLQDGITIMLRILKERLRF